MHSGIDSFHCKDREQTCSECIYVKYEFLYKGYNCREPVNVIIIVDQIKIKNILVLLILIGMIISRMNIRISRSWHE